MFAYGGLSSRDVTGPVRSIDIMPTILSRMGIPVTAPMDGRAWRIR